MAVIIKTDHPEIIRDMCLTEAEDLWLWAHPELVASLIGEVPEAEEEYRGSYAIDFAFFQFNQTGGEEQEFWHRLHAFFYSAYVQECNLLPLKY